MKLRIFALIACLVLLLSAVSCGNNGNDNDAVETDVGTINVTETGDTESDTSELNIADTNKAQSDRENEENAKEYLDYKEGVSDNDIMHVPFD